jgi:uncharacterized protein (TIGR02391 family)
MARLYDADRNDFVSAWKMSALCPNVRPDTKADDDLLEIEGIPSMPTTAAEAITALQRRLGEVRAQAAPRSEGEVYDLPDKICSRVNATLRDVFGESSPEFRDFKASRATFWDTCAIDWQEHQPKFSRAISKVIDSLTNAIDLLTERAKRSDSTDQNRALRAYEGLDLHPEIERAAGSLYRNGHYANAIEDAVKALSGLVRLRSDLAVDGAPLMTTALSVDKPILRFNDLADASDKDEQRGFMMMFAGAVAGLRNPRAHKLIKDDPERALEFIAFVSLLAKLLDSAVRVPRDV